jgi:2-iminobutanoate/2-iminopropanoate deaminase
MTARAGKQILDVGLTGGPFSPAVIAGGVCYLSGQGGLDPATGEVVEGGIRPETHQTLRNVEAVLAAGGMTLSDVVTVTCYLVDIDEWPAMNEVYAAHFDDSRPYPARTAVAVAALPNGMRVEMTVIAVPPAGLPPREPTSS